MLQKLRNKKGFTILPGLVIGQWAVGFICAAISMSAASYVLKDSHRERKAVELCYCQQTTGDEYFCKSEGAIGSYEIQPGPALDGCKDLVMSMSQEEIKQYIQDDVLMPIDDNLGFLTSSK